MIHDIYDFAALMMKDREQDLSSVRPTSVEIKGDPGTRLFWLRVFEVRLRHIELPVQAAAEKFVYDQIGITPWFSDPTASRKIVSSGECTFDDIGSRVPHSLSR